MRAFARLLAIVAALTAFAVLAFPATALAANTIVVTTAADDDTAQPTDCTLRDAITAANTDQSSGGCPAGSGADTIEVPKGTYFLDEGQLFISSDVNIGGAGARSTIISGAGAGQRDIEISSGNVTIAGVTIENGNTSTGNDPNHGVGGGIWVDSAGSLTLQDSTVTDNHADQSGGGIDSDGSLTVVRSTIENNQAGCGVINCGFGIGGGIDSFGSSLSITNSTVMGNDAQGDGGGLYVGGPNTLLTNDTIANNLADQGGTGEIGGGGIAVAFGNAADITNTLLAGNLWNGDGGNCSARITSLGGNLADDTTCALTAAEQQGVNPELGPIDSSGPTDVLPLRAGSSAIDAGTVMACPATDQRGVSRPQGAGCDIGAYELVPTSIAFESNRGGNSQIWAMNPDGTNVTQITHDASTVTDSLPSISPDGHTIVYQSTTAGGITQIWAINGDGSNPHQLTSQGTANRQPTFSPDGTKIAFDSNRNGNSQLFVMNADGSGQTQVMTTDGNVGGSSWSPDGSQIAFNDDTNGTNEIYTVDVGTGIVSGPLTTAASDGANTNPHWSPDGSKILFVSDRCDPFGLAVSPTCGGGESVFLMNADGTSQQNLTRAPIFDADPAWSPDGTQIAFVRDLGGQNFNVFTANADGTNQIQLTFGGAPSRNSFPNWGTQLSAPGGPMISGTVSANGQQNADLTALGTDDWAVWGFANSGTSTSLTPDVRKSGGAGISDLTDVDPTAAPLRGLGQFAGQGFAPFGFDWSNGSGPASATGAAGGLEHDGQPASTPTTGDGFSFTVPADTSERTVTVFTSEHWGTGTLTATLSDGSAQPYTQTVVGDPTFPSFGGNAPGVFTIHYAAASAGQQLTVKFVETDAQCPAFSCDDAAIYAVALSSALSNLTVDAAPSNAGAGIDQVPIDTIPNAWISFLAGSTNSAPVGSTPVGSTPVGSTPVGSTPVGSTPVGSTPVGSTPVGSTPVGSTPVGSTGLFDLPVGSTPVGSTALSSVLLSQVQLHGTSWDQILCGSLANKPLNSITLEDVKDSTEQCSNGSTSLQNLKALDLNQVDLGTTLLRTVHWATLLMGNTPLSALPGGFDAWCGTTGSIPEGGGSCSNATGQTTVLQMDVAGQLGSAPVGSTPVGSTPVGSTPVGSTPVGSTDIAASLLANIPLHDIDTLDGDLSTVVDCTKVDCSPGTTETLGDAQAAGAIKPLATFSNIQLAMAANNITINDLVVAIIGAAGFPWERLPIQGLQPYSATPTKVTYTIGNQVDCSIAPAYKITVHLPTGFFPVNGSAQFSVGNNAPQSAGAPHVVGNDAQAAAKNNAYQWDVSCPPGDNSFESATLTFDAWVGLNLGTFTTHVSASTAVASIGVTGAPVIVHQNPEASDPSAATEIKPDTLVAGHIAFSGEQAFYKVKLTDSQGNPLPTGTRISAFLNVPDNADLDLTMSAPAAPSFFTTPVGSTPVGSTPIEDSPVGFSSNGLALPPDTLQDVPVGSTPVGSTPVGSTPVGSTSANRGTGVNEAGAIITSGQGGYATIGVSGYNGATSNKPFVLRVQQTPPPPLPDCPARTFPNNTPPSSFAAGTLPSSLPTTTKTLFIVDKQRLTAMYGSPAVTSLLNSLSTLAGRSEVSGTVLFVDGDQGVRDAYSAWDATPCDTTARNTVVRAINDVVASYRNSATGLPNLHYIVLVGSDEATPMADTPDPVLLSPEENEASDLAFTTNGLLKGNALYASAAQNQILTDGAYGAFTNIPWLGRSLLLPQISVSRLVETPSDIVGQIDRYLGNNGLSAPQSAVGTLNPTSALVTGYDFLADGAQSVESNLTNNFSGLQTPFDNFRPGVPAINVPGGPWKASTVYHQGDIVVPTTANPDHLTFQAQNDGTSGLVEPIWPISLVQTVLGDGGVSWKAIAPWTATDVLSNALTAASPPSILSIDAHYNHYELESAAGDLANSGQASGVLAARILFTMGCHGGLNISDTFDTATSPNKYLDWPEFYAQKQAAMYIANTGFGYGDTASVALSERLLALFAKNLHSDSGSVGEEWVNALQQYFATAGAYDVYDEKVMEETTFYGLPFWHFSTAGSSPSFTPLTPSPDPITGTPSATIAFPTGATAGTQFGLYRPNLPITSQQVTSSLPARSVWIKALASNDTNTNAMIGYPTIDLTAHEPAPDVSPIFFPASPFTLERSIAFGAERDYLNVSDQFRPTGPGNAGVQRSFTSGTFEIFYSQSADQLAPLISQVNVSDTSGTATIAARVTDDSGHVAEAAALVNDGTSWRYLQLDQSTLDPTLWSGTISVANDPEVFVEATDGVNVSYSANKGENFTSTNSNSPPSGVQITIQAPVGPYALDQTVKATYQCGSAAAQCIGTVDPDQPIDTSTFGMHTFVVQALDADGNVIGSLQRTYVVQYTFNGFFAPVDNEPVLNVVKAGNGVPLKFSLGGYQGLDIFAAGYPKSQTIACDATAPADGIETTVNTGSSSLSYDSSTDQYSYVWKTDKSWSGTCRALIVKTKDGVTHRADFKFK